MDILSVPLGFQVNLTVNGYMTWCGLGTTKMAA